MTQTIRLFLLFEVATFLVAALIHRGYLIEGYAHRQAHVAESIIAAVLFGGLLLSLFMGAWTRKVALVVQGFALVGTLMGIFMIIVGVGPRTVPDIVYHVAIVLVLIAGILLARRALVPPRGGYG
jgi:hypothetical protein